MARRKEIIIKSANSDALLRFFDIEGDYFSICFESSTMRVAARVWGYGDCEQLVDMFVYMADSWQGWTEELSWWSLKREFEINATSDKLGHVNLCISINNEYTSEPFFIKANLLTEAGQLDNIAEQMKGFFNYS